MTETNERESGAAPEVVAPVAPPLPNTMSVFSMLAGIFGILTGISLILSVAAVVMGHLASKRQPYAKGYWLTGIITGYIGIGIFLLFIAAVAATIIARAN